MVSFAYLIVSSSRGRIAQLYMVYLLAQCLVSVGFVFKGLRPIFFLGQILAGGAYVFLPKKNL